MAAITIRNLSDETHRALKIRAAAHGRSTESEIRAILEEAARPKDRLKLGSALVALFQPFGGIDLDIDCDRTPPEPATFE